MSVGGRRAVVLLNCTAASAQVKVDWSKLGLDGTPRSLRDVFSERDLPPDETVFSVPSNDLLLMIIDGEDKTPAEYPASQANISGIPATSAPTFAVLQYRNSSDHVAIIRVKSSSGFSTALALTPTLGSETGAAGLILPKGTADLSFTGKAANIGKLAVYSW
jgi:hypothetical protein